MSSTRSSGPSGSPSAGSEKPTSVWGIASFVVALSASFFAFIDLLLILIPVRFWPDMAVGVPQRIRLLLMALWMGLVVLGLLIAAGGLFESNRSQRVTAIAAGIHVTWLVCLFVMLVGVFLLDPARLSIPDAYETRLPSVDVEPTSDNRGRLSRLTDVPDPLRLLELLKQRHYEELTERIQQVIKRYRNGATSDRPVDYVFESFRSGKIVRRRLDEWVASQPSNPIPRIARAYHHAHVGSLARGSGLANETPDEYFQRMVTHHDSAIQDLNDALEMNSRLTVAYAKLLDVGMNRAGDEWIEKVLRKGLKQDPASWEIRQDYLEARQPKWGGSFKIMKEFIEDSLEHVDANPELRALAGYLAYAKAQDPRMFDDETKRFQLLDRAVRLGNVPWFLEQRAEIHQSRGDLVRAMRDIDRALRLLPQEQSFLETRAEIHRDNGDTIQALRDLDRAIKLDPMNYRLRYDRAKILMAREEYRKAVRDFEAAVVYQPKTAYHWSQMGYIRLTELEDYERAEKDLRRAIELNPDKGLYRYNLIWALFRQKDCRITDAIEDYLQFCGGEGECDSGRRESARKFRKQFKEESDCY